MCIRDRLQIGLKVPVSWVSGDGLSDTGVAAKEGIDAVGMGCLLYTSDAADERSSVDLGGRRIIKKKQQIDTRCRDRLSSTT